MRHPARNVKAVAGNGRGSEIPEREQKPEAMHPRQPAPLSAIFRPSSGLLLFLPHVAALPLLAKSCTAPFALVFHPALTFTLLSLILSCMLFGHQAAFSIRITSSQETDKKNTECQLPPCIYLSRKKGKSLWQNQAETFHRFSGFHKLHEYMIYNICF